MNKKNKIHSYCCEIHYYSFIRCVRWFATVKFFVC